MTDTSILDGRKRGHHNLVEVSFTQFAQLRVYRQYVWIERAQVHFALVMRSAFPTSVELWKNSRPTNFLWNLEFSLNQHYLLSKIEADLSRVLLFYFYEHKPDGLFLEFSFFVCRVPTLLQYTCILFRLSFVTCRWMVFSYKVFGQSIQMISQENFMCTVIKCCLQSWFQWPNYHISSLHFWKVMTL